MMFQTLPHALEELKKELSSEIANSSYIQPASYPQLKLRKKIYLQQFQLINFEEQ